MGPEQISSLIERSESSELCQVLYGTYSIFFELESNLGLL